MSELLILADARTRGIALPSDNAVAQDMLDETEAWLIRRIGQLTGERTERFYVGPGETRGRLGLQRYTDEVDVTDGDVVVDPDHVRLVERGSAIVRTYSAASRWWLGPYVEVTYTPNDEALVRAALYNLAALAVAQQSGGVVQSEAMGNYSYTTGGGSTSQVPASRAVIASAILPKRNPLVTLYSRGRPIERGESGVINWPEPTWP